MNRFFFIKGDALTPARFWGFWEIKTWQELLHLRRSEKRNASDGHIWKVPNEEVESYKLCIMNKIKKI